MREGECVCVCVWERERESVYVAMGVRACVCVCMCLRERFFSQAMTPGHRCINPSTFNDCEPLPIALKPSLSFYLFMYGMDPTGWLIVGPGLGLVGLSSAQRWSALSYGDRRKNLFRIRTFLSKCQLRDKAKGDSNMTLYRVILLKGCFIRPPPFSTRVSIFLAEVFYDYTSVVCAVV